MAQPPASMEEEKFLQGYEQGIAEMQRNSGGVNQYAPTMMGGVQKQNLVEWQLDFKPELESIERALRNDILVKDENGNSVWIENPDKEKVLLNDLGVSDIIQKIILLINKNKVLSNYSEEQVQVRLKYIAHAVRELIYLNYEYYGMDNDYKWNCYYSLVVDLDDMIESAYRRALYGEERKDLNSARMVNQTEPMMPQNNFQMYPMMQNQKKKHWFMPWR